MREHDLQPRRRRRFVATTDSAHDLPVFPNLAPEVVPDGPNQLWNGDITYVAVAAGFVYVALIIARTRRRDSALPVSRRPAESTLWKSGAFASSSPPASR